VLELFRAPHARRLQPTAVAFVSYGFVLVRVRNAGVDLYNLLESELELVSSALACDP
jgi:hypothetical protein